MQDYAIVKNNFNYCSPINIEQKYSVIHKEEYWDGLMASLNSCTKEVKEVGFIENNNIIIYNSCDIIVEDKTMQSMKQQDNLLPIVNTIAVSKELNNLYNIAQCNVDVLNNKANAFIEDTSFNSANMNIKDNNKVIPLYLNVCSKKVNNKNKQVVPCDFTLSNLDKAYTKVGQTSEIKRFNEIEKVLIAGDFSKIVKQQNLDPIVINLNNVSKIFINLRDNIYKKDNNLIVVKKVIEEQVDKSTLLPSITAVVSLPKIEQVVLTECSTMVSYNGKADNATQTIFNSVSTIVESRRPANIDGNQITGGGGLKNLNFVITKQSYMKFNLSFDETKLIKEIIGLPLGITYNSEFNCIEGVPMKAGKYPFSIMFKDNTILLGLIEVPNIARNI